MTLTSGDEFSKAATPDQALLLKLAALADAGNGSVLSPLTEHGGAPSRRTATANTGADMMGVILQQQRDEQVRQLNERLADLDRRSEEQLRAAQERLTEILRTANKTKDGRAVFQDEDGTIYDEHGNKVGIDEVDWDAWHTNAPSWEQFNSGIQDVETAKANVEKIQTLKDALANDPSAEALSAAADEIDAMEATMADSLTNPAGASAPETRSTSAAKLYDGNPAELALTPMFSGAVIASTATPDSPKLDSPSPGLSPG